MIPVTENTITAVAALIYNTAYDQDPGAGWLAHESNSEPDNSRQWVEWSRILIQVLQEEAHATDEHIIALAKQRVDLHTMGFAWNTIWMYQDEEGDVFSTMTHESTCILPLVRRFLEEPEYYPEIHFVRDDPVYMAYLQTPWESGSSEKR